MTLGDIRDEGVGPPLGIVVLSQFGTKLPDGNPNYGVLPRVITRRAMEDLLSNDLLLGVSRACFQGALGQMREQLPEPRRPLKCFATEKPIHSLFGARIWRLALRD
jgi:hypothetical protein